jgi:hypothetical protein
LAGSRKQGTRGSKKQETGSRIMCGWTIPGMIIPGGVTGVPKKGCAMPGCGIPISIVPVGGMKHETGGRRKQEALGSWCR